ncbi:MAG TPA: hypothetical protein VG125_12915 [Pirellulales bacterium]|nr:hypothetical protein [Pirellulales bacterium]
MFVEALNYTARSLGGGTAKTTLFRPITQSCRFLTFFRWAIPTVTIGKATYIMVAVRVLTAFRTTMPSAKVWAILSLMRMQSGAKHGECN